MYRISLIILLQFILQGCSTSEVWVIRRWKGGGVLGYRSYGYSAKLKKEIRKRIHCPDFKIVSNTVKYRRKYSHRDPEYALDKYVEHDWQKYQKWGPSQVNLSKRRAEVDETKQRVDSRIGRYYRSYRDFKENKQEQLAPAGGEHGRLGSFYDPYNYRRGPATKDQINNYNRYKRTYEGQEFYGDESEWTELTYACYIYRYYYRDQENREFDNNIDNKK